MAISICPAKPDDSDEMLWAGLAAFANDPLSIAQHRRSGATPEQTKEIHTYRSAITKMRMQGRGSYYFKAVDGSNGSIVGYVGLYAPDAERVPHGAVPAPPQVDSAIESELYPKMEQVKKKWLKDRDDVWYVQSMVVHPDYQGQNIATRLLQRGLEEADKAGQDTYLEGTAAAQKLYKRCGFESLEDIEMLDGKYIIKAMIRHPKNHSENST